MQKIGRLTNDVRQSGGTANDSVLFEHQWRSEILLARVRCRFRFRNDSISLRIDLLRHLFLLFVAVVALMLRERSRIGRWIV